MHRAPDNIPGMILGLVFVVVGGFFLVRGLLGRGGGPEEQRPAGRGVLRGWPPFFARIWLTVMGFSMIGFGAAIAIDNLIYADTHHHQSGVGVIFWPTYAICLGSGGMFIKPSAVPNMKGGRLLFYRFMGFVFVCIGGFGIFLIAGAWGGIWHELSSYLNDIEKFLATGRAVA